MSLSTGSLPAPTFQGIERIYRGHIAADQESAQHPVPLIPANQTPPNYLADVVDQPRFGDVLQDTHRLDQRYSELLVPGRYARSLEGVYGTLHEMVRTETGERRRVLERALDVLQEERALRTLFDTYRLALFAG